ncbi:hypothetical protein ACFRMQ_19390 [Kitasatospora sp. NPDC056783]|uniref:hypothetical protein n=1 Tax=Kitasatospora sp. NPDC056783 TaxID=3345943 RepID=UPI003688F5A8
MARKALQGIELAVHEARRRRERAGEPPITGDSLINGPSLGSVVRDNRAGGRIGIVTHVTGGIAYLREAGRADQVWDCPVTAVEKPPRADAELALLLDHDVVLRPTDAPDPADYQDDD